MDDDPQSRLEVPLACGQRFLKVRRGFPFANRGSVDSEKGEVANLPVPVLEVGSKLRSGRTMTRG